MLNHCRVVLVQPRIAGNIGATARIMHNMGLSDLVLVAPEADPADRNARQQSTQGEEILDRARVVGDFADAVADCVLVAGTSARTGGLFRRQSMGTPDEIMPHLTKALAADHPVALVFGTEPRGLTNAEVTRCHYLIHIPAEPTYPALNLAQAVAICLYELRRAWETRQSLPAPQGEPLAAFAAQEHMFAQLRTALAEIHFLYGPKAEPLMHALRHLLGRANMTDMEVDVLLGLARQIRWYVNRHVIPDQAGYNKSTIHRGGFDMDNPEKNNSQAAEEEFKKRLLELGLLTRITPPLPPDAIPRNRKPAPVSGNPVSEMIIKERR